MLFQLLKRLSKERRPAKPWVSKQNKLEYSFVILGPHKGFGAWNNFGVLYLSDRIVFNKGKTIRVNCDNPKNPTISFNMIKADEPSNIVLILLKFKNGDIDVLFIREESVLYTAIDKRKFDPSLKLNDDEMAELKATLEDYYAYPEFSSKKDALTFSDEDKEDFERSLWL